ncbi:MAG: aldo/keto reductase [Gammaproteobacteria bacterium]|nr:aldo/keto reductase [Gammaproteobacteria bacterium]
MNQLSCVSGEPFPLLGLGTWKSGPGEVSQAVREALDIGYRHIDCAAIYQNEVEIGDALSHGGINRGELWITSKLWNNAHRGVDVEPALRKTLNDLRLDFLDLYLIHWPVAFKKEVISARTRDDYIGLDEVPISETWHALEECVAKGLVRHIGVSNFSVRKLQSILRDCSIKPAANQVELHPLLAQEKLRMFCQNNDIQLIAHSPLGSRDRLATYKSQQEPDLFELEVIKDIAAERALSPAQVLLAWAINRGTAVIPKSVNPGHLRSNFEAAAVDLSAAEMSRINKLDRLYRYINGSFLAGKKSPYTIGGIWDE